MSAPLGQCLHCDGKGPVGALCETAPCVRRGYAYVPLAYAGDVLDQADGLLGVRLDDYLLVALLGAGGFGRVYLALQQPIQLRAALKLLTRLEPRFIEKFRGEAHALAHLSHPNVVRLLKFGYARKLPYLVMEYVDGAVLSSALADPRSPVHGLDVAAHIVRQVTNALDAAHAASIIHRDIKPSNILIQSVPGDPAFVRVLDFGIAKFLSETSDTSVAMGTPIYMAPETITRTNIGPWTDLYSLGVMSFELLFGMPPWAGEVAEGLVTGALTSVPDPLAGRRRLLPAAAIAFFERALARQPEQRLRTASEFRAAWSTALEALRALPRETWRALRPAVPPEDVSPTTDTHRDAVPAGAAAVASVESLAGTDRAPVRAWAIAAALALGSGVGLALAIDSTASRPAPTEVATTDVLLDTATAPGADPGAPVDPTPLPDASSPAVDDARAATDDDGAGSRGAPAVSTNIAADIAPNMTSHIANDRDADMAPDIAATAAPTTRRPTREADADAPEARETTPPTAPTTAVDAGPTPARGDASADYIFVE